VHRERSRALADEMGRRLEPGAGANAAARKECYHGGVDVPAERVGGVTRLLVVGEEADERPPEAGVKRREDEGKNRLRDARVRGEVIEVRLEALAPRECLDEP
jgi:hypothetical protein